MSLTIVIEGGSKGNESVEKKGFSVFFGKVCAGSRPRVKLAGGRGQAMKAFLDEHRMGNDVVLLIDAEGPCNHDTAHSFLVATAVDHGIHQIANANVDDVHLMVQVMESWLFADPAGVKSRVRHLSDETLASELRRRGGNLELIPKPDAIRLFEEACGSKYRKVSHLEFIGQIDPVKVEAGSAFAAALFRRLRGEESVWP